jgi:hypothetical protein
VNWLCQQLPFHAVGTKVNDAVLHAPHHARTDRCALIILRKGTT